VEVRGVAVGVADGRALLDLARLGMELRARAEEVRPAVQDAECDSVVIGDAEAALAVSQDDGEVARTA